MESRTNPLNRSESREYSSVVNTLWISRGRKDGIALVMTLSFMVLVTVIVIAFLLSSTTEYTSSKSYASSSEAKRLSDTAVQVIIGQIRLATSGGTSVAWASQPGMIRTFGTTGAPASAARQPLTYYKLYSSDAMVVPQTQIASFKLSDEVPVGWEKQQALFTDLNAPALSASNQLEYPIMDPGAAAIISGTNSLVEGCSIASPASYSGANPTAKNNPAPMPVKWLYMLKDGTITAPSGVDSTGNVANWTGVTDATKVPSAINPIVARIAFWTDDETCKLNLNTACGSNYWDSPMFESGLELEFSRYQTAAHEYTRYPGHPSTTSLLPVLWNYGGLGSPDAILFPGFAPTIQGGLLSAAIAPSDPPLSSAAAVYFQKLMSLNPRNAWGGSQAGSRATLTTSYSDTTGTNQLALSALDTDRLFASVDEMMFATPRTSRASAVTNEFQFAKSDLDKIRFFLTTTSKSPEVNMFNLPKVSMWPVHDKTATNPVNPSQGTGDSSRSPVDSLLAFCSTLNGNPYYFQRNDPTSISADFSGTGGQRNLALYSYLERLMGQAVPGFGASFQSRYGTLGDQQILTECFDYIRSTINLVDGSGPSSSPLKYAFTNLPSLSAGKATNNVNPGTGQVVPIVHPTNGTKGIGRFPTIKQAAIMFIARAANQPPVIVDPATGIATSTINPMHPWIGTPSASVTQSGGTYTLTASNKYPTYASAAGNAALPTIATAGQYQTHAGLPFLSEIDQANGKFDLPNPRYHTDVLPILSPHQTQMEAIFLIDPVDIAVGYVPLGVNYKVRVTGLNNLKVDGSSLGFQNSETQSSTSQPNAIGDSYAYSIGSNSINNTGTLMFHSAPVTISPNTNHVAGEVFAFGGGNNVKVEILTASGAVVQTINLNFPDSTFPTPLLPIQPGGISLVGGGSTAAPPAAVKDLTPSWLLSFDNTSALCTNPNFGVSGMPGGSSYPTTYSRGMFGLPYTNAAGYFFMAQWPFGSDSTGNYKLTADTVRSLECAFGDTRVIASLQNVPSSFFLKHKYYDDSTMRSAHSFHGNGTRLDYDSFIQGGTAGYLTSAHSAVPSLYYYNSPISWIDSGNPDFANGATQAIKDLPVAGASKFPHVTSSVDFNDSTFLSVWANGGDYDNGPNHQADGPYINKPSEGFATGTLAYPDFEDQNYTANGTSIFPPNRQIPSSVMFGSLPVSISSGVASPGNLTPGNASFWRTLLFCPNPNSQTHVSLNQNPPDYAFLDLFNMPVVEPYTISEPFSTAGRVNMNYQIAPFTYIKRDTALRGVLRSTMIAAVQDNWMQYYKSGQRLGGASVFGDAGNAFDQQALQSGYFNFRYPINPTQTLQQFDTRFNSGDVFRSPSEICSIWLYPGTQPTSASSGQISTPLVTDSAGSTANIRDWWYNNAGTSRKSLTGDNMRERPYSTLYPQLTTKSNSYTVHYRVQVLKKVPSLVVDQWDERKDQVLGEYRGSTLIERYIDPSNSNLPDFATNLTAALDDYYNFRVLSVRRFTP